jgi:transposase-like protein
MARHRTHPIAFKRQIAQEFLSGEVSLHGLAQRNDICRNLIRFGSRSMSAASSTMKPKPPIFSSNKRPASPPWSGWWGALRSRRTF